MHPNFVLASLAATCLVAAPASAASTCSFTMNRFGIPNWESMYKCGIQLSKEHGIDPCWAVVGMQHENGMTGRYSIGYDEGHNGEKYDESKPDLGLDFGHRHYGLGPMQVTLFPQYKGILGTMKWCKPGVPSIELEGACYVAQGLVTPLRGIRAGVLAYKKCGAAGGNPSVVWPCVGGKKSVAEFKDPKVRKEINSRIADTQACLGSKDVTKSLKRSTRCRGDAPISQKACRAESAALEKAGRLGYACDQGCVDILPWPVKNAQLVWDYVPEKKGKKK